MATLTGVSISSSYTSLLKLDGNTDSTAAGNGSNAIQVKTGDNEATPLFLNTDRLGIGGQPSNQLTVVGDNAIKNINIYTNSDSAVTSDTGARIFTTGDGGSGIYAENGHLVIQGRPSNARDVIFISGNSATERMRITGDGLLGIGTENPDTNLHIHKATAGTIDSNANAQLTIENNSHAGLQFLTPNSANNIIYFGDVDDNDVGYIAYLHNSNEMEFLVDTSVRFKLDANSRISLGNNDASGVATNTVFGNLAGNFSGGSANCTAIGLRALDALTGGSQNLGVGEDALGASVDGVSNTAVGVYAMSAGDAANYNTAIGGQSLSFVTGSSNTGVGFQSATTGSNNITSGSDNTLIGAFTAASSASATNQIVIGKSATGTGDNEIALGNTSITAIKAQVSSITAYSSDERTKKDIKDYNLKGLDFIKDLQLKTYIYKNPADFPDEIRSSKWDEEGVEKQADPTETQVGLIAQDVEEALKKHGIGNIETYAPTQESGIKTLTYGNLIFPLIKAVQELSAKVTELENK
jgi:hypothetical protein